jgi:hypothetical protein
MRHLKEVQLALLSGPALRSSARLPKKLARQLGVQELLPGRIRKESMMRQSKGQNLIFSFLPPLWNIR